MLREGTLIASRSLRCLEWGLVPNSERFNIAMSPDSRSSTDLLRTEWQGWGDAFLILCAGSAVLGSGRFFSLPLLLFLRFQLRFDLAVRNLYQLCISSSKFLYSSSFFIEFVHLDCIIDQLLFTCK